MENPELNTKQSNVGYIVTIVILALATTGLLITLLIVLFTKGDCNCAGDQGGDTLDSLSRSRRNTQREDDISRFLTAANDFQTNNNGKTPWHGDKTNEKWVTRYIDNYCSYSYSIADVEYYNCKVGSSEFRDPDGETYRIRYVGDLKWDYDLDSKMSAWPNNHEIVVATNAMCGDNDTFETGYSSRQYAMAYRLEGGSITCNDNH